MALKRSADAMDGVAACRPRRGYAKKAKLSPEATAQDNSSEPSSCSVSEDSALHSSPPASQHTRQSSMSSMQSTNYEDDSESSISTSSDESSDNDDSEDEIVTITKLKKPAMTDTGSDPRAQDLRSRLSSLLPQIAKANLLLSDAQGGPGLGMEDVDEDEEHIEMNLGLGVLEEKNENEDSDSDSESDSDEGESGDDEDLPASSGAVRREPEDRGANVMGKLMGQKSSSMKRGIEDLS